MFNIGDKLDKANYTQGAIWCNANNCVINPDTWTIEAIPEPTAKETAQEKIAELKAQLVASDYVANKLIEAYALNDMELFEMYRAKYKDKIEERKAIRAKIDELEEIING
jgi:hypothetical protein